jgi:AAA domain
MTDVLFRHLEVTNFRSIKGTIHAPLDAKVVLVHGENGAGKTSLLAAGSPCSPARTRLLPLPGCRAPDAGDGSHGEDAPVPPAHRLSARQPLAGIPLGCFTQVAIDCVVGSNSHASSSGVRPDRTRSTICRRNSGG